MKHKLDRIRDIILRKDLDAIVLTATPNLEYLFEIREPYCIVVIFKDSTYKVYVSELDYPRLCNIVDKDSVVIISRRGYTSFENIPVVKASELSEEISRILSNCRRVGVDKMSKVSTNLKSKGVEVEDVNDDVLNIRREKSSYELELIKKAIRITEKALENVISLIKPDVREVDIEAELLKCIALEEAEPAFKPIVAAGPDAAIPHHVSTKRRIARGELVIIDVGARVRCYCSDITRTFVVGSPSSEAKDLYYAVVEAQKEALKKVRIGEKCQEADMAARKVLHEYGVEKYFIHGLGHGLGIEYHEKPSLSPESEDSFIKGDVVTVEPGIYIPDRLGIRIEDDVAVTDEGPQILTRFPQVLI